MRQVIESAQNHNELKKNPCLLTNATEKHQFISG